LPWYSYHWNFKVGARTGNHISNLIISHRTDWLAKRDLDWLSIWTMSYVPNFNTSISTTSCNKTALRTELYGTCSIFMCFPFANYSWGNLVLYILRLIPRHGHTQLKIRARYQCCGSSILNRQSTKIVAFKFWTLYSLFGLHTALE
jgi:hypothetical protein